MLNKRHVNHLLFPAYSEVLKPHADHILHMTEAAALKDAVFRDLSITAACAKQQHHRQKKKENTP